MTIICVNVPLYYRQISFYPGKNFIMFWANPIMSEQAPLYSRETVLCFPYLSLYLWKSSLYDATLLSLCACMNAVMTSCHYILVKHCYVLGCHHYVLSKQHVIIMRWVAAIMGLVWKPRPSCRAEPSRAENAEPDIVFSYICSNEFKILISFNLILPYM